MESTRQSKKRAATQEVPEADPSERLQLSHGNKVFKQLQDNQEADYDKNCKKSCNRHRIIHPLSKSMPAINIMYTNTDQFTAMQKLELSEFVERKKPHIIAIGELKPKIPSERRGLCNSWLLFVSTKS